MPTGVVIPENAEYTVENHVEWTETTDKVEREAIPAVTQVVHYKYQSHNLPPDIVIPDHATHTSINPETNMPYVHRKLNPDFDPTTTYIPRSRRVEWVQVALLGRVRIHKDAPKHPQWRFLHTVTEDVEEWFIR